MLARARLSTNDTLSCKHSARFWAQLLLRRSVGGPGNRAIITAAAMTCAAALGYCELLWM
jgi:hypothetical protein